MILAEIYDLNTYYYKKYLFVDSKPFIDKLFANRQYPFVINMNLNRKLEVPNRHHMICMVCVLSHIAINLKRLS